MQFTLFKGEVKISLEPGGLKTVYMPNWHILGRPVPNLFTDTRRQDTYLV